MIVTKKSLVIFVLALALALLISVVHNGYVAREIMSSIVVCGDLEARMYRQ